MRFGLLFDLRNPPAWQRPWPEHYARALDLVRDVESAGLDSVWFTEHHGCADGYLPQPLTFAAAVAARTERVRIGTAILLAALRHPRHVAEQAAVIDLLSAGRLELGVGAGYAPAEYAAFGVDIARRFGLTDRAAADIAALLGEVTPAPVQRPVPLWLGYQGPQGARRAGRLGAGLLSLAPELLDPYRAGLAEGGHDPAGARMGGLLAIVLADDPPVATEAILPHYAYQLNSYRALAGASSREVTVEELRAGYRARGRIPGLTVLTAADAVAEIRRRVAGLPVRHVYLWASVAGMPDDLVRRQVELLADVVAPALRAGSA